MATGIRSNWFTIYVQMVLYDCGGAGCLRDGLRGSMNKQETRPQHLFDLSPWPPLDCSRTAFARNLAYSMTSIRCPKWSTLCLHRMSKSTSLTSLLSTTAIFQPIAHPRIPGPWKVKSNDWTAMIGSSGRYILQEALMVSSFVTAAAKRDESQQLSAVTAWTSPRARHSCHTIQDMT
jgi:hypothetical protein